MVVKTALQIGKNKHAKEDFPPLLPSGPAKMLGVKFSSHLGSMWYFHPLLLQGYLQADR